MAFELPPLPYDYDTLEPVISKETMTFHHDKHHAAYTNKLNEAVAADTSLQGKSIEDILANISSAPAAVRNNGGGFWNHDFFWKIMTKPGTTQPSGKLAEAIEAFGGLDKLKDEFNTKGAGQFGSGWAWVIADAEGKEVRIPTKEIDTNRETMLSPMPANFGDAIPEADFNHLLAYLLEQKAKEQKR